jgi:hypothetical protein
VNDPSKPSHCIVHDNLWIYYNDNTDNVSSEKAQPICITPPGNTETLWGVPWKRSRADTSFQHRSHNKVADKSQIMWDYPDYTDGRCD